MSGSGAALFQEQPGIFDRGLQGSRTDSVYFSLGLFVGEALGKHSGWFGLGGLAPPHMHLVVVGNPVAEGHHKLAVVRTDLAGAAAVVRTGPVGAAGRDPEEPLLDRLGTLEHLRSAKQSASGMEATNAEGISYIWWLSAWIRWLLSSSIWRLRSPIGTRCTTSSRSHL